MTATRRALIASAVLVMAGLGTLAAFPPPAFRPPPPVRPPVRPPVTIRPPVVTPPVRPPITRPPGGRPEIMRPPAEVRVELRQMAKTNPSTAIQHLRGQEGRTLSEPARLEIAREAVRAMAQRVQQSRDLAFSMREVSQARAEAASLPEAMRKPLDRLHESTHRRMLAEALAEVASLAEAGDWAEARGRAEGWARAMADSGGKGPLHEAAEAACRGMADVAVATARIDRFRAALDGKGDAIAAGLPTELAKQAEVLRGLADLRDAAGHKGARPPGEQARLVDTLSRLEKLADPALMKRVALDLAVKALIEGRTAEFEQLMPRDVPPAEAARALRDLKALALGEGKVGTWAGKEAVPDGPASPRPPPGLAPLVPEGRRDGWRPPVKEPAGAGLPALEEAAVLGKKVAEQAKDGAKAERARLDGEAAKARAAVAAARAKVQEAERVEGKRFAPIEHRLDRRLTPDERLMSRDLIDEGKDADAVLRELAAKAADDDDLFLQAVERLMRRPLTDDEKAQARRLRRAGRRASEVAELLRT